MNDHQSLTGGAQFRSKHASGRFCDAYRVSLRERRLVRVDPLIGALVNYPSSRARWRERERERERVGGVREGGGRRIENRKRSEIENL